MGGGGSSGTKWGNRLLFAKKALRNGMGLFGCLRIAIGGTGGKSGGGTLTHDHCCPWAWMFVFLKEKGNKGGIKRRVHWKESGEPKEEGEVI